MAAYSQLDKVVIAGLLHDVGKFWQRTGANRPYTQQEDDHFGLRHKHALWSAHFVEQYLDDAEMADWVRTHHSPGTLEPLVISLADWLSSGERIRSPEQELGRPEDAPLVNILSQVSLPGRPPAQGGSHFPLTRHADFAHGFMPAVGAPCGQSEYAWLWDAFARDLDALSGCQISVGTWLALFGRHTRRIPAATPTRVGDYVPDISLYDHCRTVAALAACFVADAMPEEQIASIRAALQSRDSSSTALATPVCRLVCGNLSGIQTFLYALTGQKAAKTLKGRSFALQLAADAAVRTLCEAAGVPETNVVYNGGGRFYLLLPLKGLLDEVRLRLSRDLQESLGGELTVHLGETSLTPRDFNPETFAGKWAEAAAQAAESKLRRLTGEAEADYDAAFGFQDLGGDAAKCACCGNEMAGTDTEGELDTLCPACSLYEGLGARLPRARYLAVYEPNGQGEAAAPGLTLCGTAYTLLEEARQLPPASRVLSITELNDYDVPALVRAFPPDGGVTLDYRVIARSWELVSEGPRQRLQTFEELAENATGARKLGVYRADVDNLGQLFATGLKGNASLSRVATLSALLKDFFEGYVDHLVREHYGGRVGVIYAGGDDLFVLGAWDAVIDFALDLSKRFDQFTGRNPSLTLSGGVAVVDDHFPIRYAADMAQRAEEQAKQYERGGVVKDAVTLFNVPIGFEEVQRFRNFQELLTAMLRPADGRRPMPKSFLRRLYDIWAVYERERRLLQERRAGQASLEDIKREAQWQRWRWMLTYGLRDFGKRHKDWKDEIDEVQQRILDADESIEDRLGVPLRWAELLCKEEGCHE